MYNKLISFIVLKLYHQRNGDDLKPMEQSH